MSSSLPARTPLRLPRLSSASILRIELLAGLLVALALIPEAISFSIIAPYSLTLAVVGLLES